MRIVPYRQPDGTVSGVLVTFVDVTSIVQAEEALMQVFIPGTGPWRWEFADHDVQGAQQVRDHIRPLLTAW
jgi:hypothetical protein